MSRGEYINLYYDNYLHYWSNIAIGIGIVVILCLIPLDYIVAPEFIEQFLLYRISAAFCFVLLFFINKKKINRTFQSITSLVAGSIIAVMIAMMIAKFGGHESVYFAGVIVLLVYVFGLIPFTVKTSILAGTIIYLTYLLPILSYDTITNKSFFISANAFILLCTLTLLIFRYLSHKRLINELSLQYDIEQQKKQLEVYSMQLKGMVEERTRDLMKSEQWHRSLVDNATDGIVVLDRNGIIINVNDRACDMYGFPKDVLIGTHVRLLEAGSPPDQITERMRRLLDGEAIVYEAVHHKKDGTPLYLEISAKGIKIADEMFIQSFYRDITEKKKFQEYLFQSQKMDSIGTLAGGIAHDFNNILTAIIGHSEIIRRSHLEEKALRSLTVIEEASRRAGRMISKLLGFARKSASEVVPFNMNDVIFDTVKLLERVVDKKINLTVELDNRLPLVQGDVTQMEQVIMNLIVNARDAMPNGGSIIIKTTAREVVRGMPDVPSYIPPGEYVIMRVSDTGVGMAGDVLNRIFEPFYTTKDRGKGTGLGLAMVYGVVKEHRGYVTVQSELNRGSVFTVYIPTSPQAAAVEHKKQLPAVNGTETVLIVDDEEDILHAMQDALTSQGYKVFAISDPSAAAEIFKKLSDQIDLVITDIVMPKLNGKELIGQVKRINPKVKVLAISGYTKYVAPKDEIGEINGFLQKPFESYYLLSVVRRILDARPHDLITR
jgi:PAS domain S-box-containing protein